MRRWLGLVGLVALLLGSWAGAAGGATHTKQKVIGPLPGTKGVTIRGARGARITLALLGTNRMGALPGAPAGSLSLCLGVDATATGGEKGAARHLLARVEHMAALAIVTPSATYRPVHGSGGALAGGGRCGNPGTRSPWTTESGAGEWAGSGSAEFVIPVSHGPLDGVVAPFGWKGSPVVMWG